MGFDWLNEEAFSTLNEQLTKEPETRDKLPDAKYTAIINSVANKPTSDGENRIVWDFIINSGEFERRHIWKNQLMKHERSAEFLGKDLRTCGVVEHLSSANLTAVLEGLTGKEVEISTVTNANGYQNVYINKALEQFPF